MERQDLQKAYNEYIVELALATLARIPVSRDLVRKIAKVQRDMLTMDIAEAVKNIKENPTSKYVMILNEVSKYDPFWYEIANPTTDEFGQPSK